MNYNDILTSNKCFLFNFLKNPLTNSFKYKSVNKQITKQDPTNLINEHQTN